MPEKARPGTKGVYVELPEGLYERVRALAVENGRPFKVELVRALERYLEAPEVVTVARREAEHPAKASHPEDASVEGQAPAPPVAPADPDPVEADQASGEKPAPRKRARKKRGGGE